MDDCFKWCCFQEDDQYYDEGGEKESGASAGPEQAPSPIPPETTPIIPTRVVPTLLSPSFDDAVTDGDKPTLSISVKPIEADDDIVQPTAVFSEPPKVYNSVTFPVTAFLQISIGNYCAGIVKLNVFLQTKMSLYSLPSNAL